MLGRLFGPRDPLIRLSRGADAHAFAEALGRSDLIVLSLPLGEGLDPWSMTPEQLLALIEANAKDLAGREDFPPFTYPREGRRCLPLFSSLGLAQVFIGEVSKQAERVLPFQALTVAGHSLREIILEAEQVALNAGTRYERLLTPEDLRAVEMSWV